MQLFLMGLNRVQRFENHIDQIEFELRMILLSQSAITPAIRADVWHVTSDAEVHSFSDGVHDIKHLSRHDELLWEKEVIECFIIYCGN